MSASTAICPVPAMPGTGEEAANACAAGLVGLAAGAPPVPPAAKPKATRTAAAKRKLDEATAKVAQLDAKFRSLVADHEVKRLKSGKSSGEAAMASRERNITAAKDKLLAAQQLEKERKDAHALLVAVEAGKQREQEEKARAALEKDDATKPMSNEAQVLLVTLRLNMQTKMDNKSDSNDKVWSHIATEYNAKVTPPARPPPRPLGPEMGPGGQVLTHPRGSPQRVASCRRCCAAPAVV